MEEISRTKQKYSIIIFMYTHYTILGQLSKILILNYNIVIYTNHHEFMSCHKGDEPLRLTKFSNLRESLPVS
jgi:hypothetical protein